MTRPNVQRACVRGVISTVAAAFMIGPVGALTAHAAPAIDEVDLVGTPAVDVGGTVDVGVVLAEATDVYTYELALSYDSSTLTYVEESAVGPDGGFDSVRAQDGLLTVVHSRLGTSPGLEGTLDLSLQFSGVAAGESEIAIDVLNVVGSDGETVSLADVAATSVTVTAVEPTSEPVTSAPPSPGGDDGEEPTTDDLTPLPTDSTSGGPTAGAGRSDDLSRTGADAGALVGAALVAVVAGGAATALVRRRSAGA